MSYDVTPDGWFRTVNSFPVQVVDAEHLDHTSYIRGFPTGIIWHYTAGFHGDILSSMEARGYATAPFSIDRETGLIYQYLPLVTGGAGWHAHEASRVYVGIEHEAFPPQTTATEKQLEVSAGLSAAVVEYVKHRWNFSIPLQHKPTQPPPNLPAGFRNHKDGTAADWNPNLHGDGLLVWSWEKYLGRVSDYLQGKGDDEMAFEDWKQGCDDQRAGTPLRDDWNGDRKRGWRDAKRMATTAPAGGIAEHLHEPGPVKQ